MSVSLNGNCVAAGRERCSSAPGVLSHLFMAATHFAPEVQGYGESGTLCRTPHSPWRPTVLDWPPCLPVRLERTKEHPASDTNLRVSLLAGVWAPTPLPDKLPASLPHPHIKVGGIHRHLATCLRSWPAAAPPPHALMAWRLRRNLLGCAISWWLACWSQPPPACPTILGSCN